MIIIGKSGVFMGSMSAENKETPYLLKEDKTSSGVRVVCARDVLDLVTEIHGRPDDLSDGDLVDRINKFDNYELKAIPLNILDLDEWEVDEDFVEDLSSEIRKGYHPIVFDPYEASIIDGIHRANALYKAGATQINAYVGKEIDPYFSS